MMRIQVLQAVNAVSLLVWFPTLQRGQEPPKQQELLMQWQSITFQKTEIHTMSSFVSTLGYFPTKVVSI